MRRIKYLLRCLAAMNPKNIVAAVRQTARKSGRFAPFVFVDMVWCALRYGAGHTDYRSMGFATMPGRRRVTFVTRGVNNDYIRRLNRREAYHMLEDKTRFNTLFARYVGREWLDLRKASFEAFDRILQNHLPIIAKPTDKMCGQGIEKIHITGETDSQALYDRLRSSGQFLIEECIRQHPLLSEVYPHSVNTLRLVTVAADDAVHIVFRVFRIGAFGNVVDNTDLGGLCAFPDDNGQLITDAINYAGDIFPAHPDTGFIFKGTRLPFFEESESLVREAARLIPGLRYVGWDVAITETGPVLIEANHNPSHGSYQVVAFMGPNEPGRRPLFAKIFENIR